MPKIFKAEFYRSIVTASRLFISKIIVRITRSLNDLDQWVTGYSHNPNARNHEHLGPNHNASNNTIYEASLLWALREPFIKNIAVTGPYGSGKSSVIASFQRKNRQFRYINVSLAMFDETQKKNDDWRNNVEFSILQQLIYHVKNDKLPESRFQKIKHSGALGRIWNSFLLLVFILGFLLLFKEEYYKNIPVWDDLTAEAKVYLKYAALGIVLVGVIRFLYWASRSIGNLKLNKVGLTSGSIELENKQDQSVFNKHLDEIIYFFEMTRHNVIVIEDLDRFGDTEIFTKLREVNNLINNSLQVDLSVKFIYAVKDDMFKDKDRAKFFDFIIPVIPVLSTANAGDKLALMLPVSARKKVNGNLLSNISLYIQDMRLLINIINEFQIYHAPIGDKLEPTKLLAVIVYKNLYPNDFARIHNGEGDIVAAFNRKKEFVEEKYLIFNTEIARLQSELESNQRRLLKSEEELRSVYLTAILAKAPLYSSIYVSKSLMPIQLLLNEMEFNHLMKEKKITCQTFKDGAWKDISLNMSFDAIEKEIDAENTYSERLKNLRYLSQMDSESTRKEIVNLRYNASRVRSYSLKDVLNYCEGFTFPEYSDKKPILNFLISEGYIDEMYPTYISFFIEGSLLQADMDFVISVSQRQPLPVDHALRNCSTIASRWFSVTTYGHPAILNINFIDWLLQQTAYPSERDELATQLANGAGTSFEFIRLYLEKGTEQGAFVSLVCGKWQGLWDYFYRDSAMKDEVKDQYFLLLVNNLNLNQLSGQDSSGYLKMFIEQHPDPIRLLGQESLAAISTALVEMLVVKLENIIYDKQFNSFYRFIVENRHYRINLQNLLSIFSLGNRGRSFPEGEMLSGNFTFISKYASGIREYIEGNLREYLINAFFKIPDHSLEEEDAMLYILNHDNIDNSLKRDVLGVINTIFSDFEKVLEKSLALEMAFNLKMKMSWDNLVAYFLETSVIDDRLVYWINKAEDFDTLNKEEWAKRAELNDAVSKSFERAILETGGIDIDRRIALAEMFYHKHEGLDIEELADNEISKLIDLDKFQLTPDFTKVLTERNTELAGFYIGKQIESYLTSPFLLADGVYEYLLSGDSVSIANGLLAYFNVHVLNVTDTIAVAITSYLKKEMEGATPPTKALVSTLLKTRGVDWKYLLDKYADMFEDTEILDQIRSLEEPYNQIAINSGQQIQVPADENTKFLLEMLKKRFPGFISKVSKTRDKQEFLIFHSQGTL